MILNKHDLPNFQQLDWSVDCDKMLSCFRNFTDTFDPVSDSYGAEYFSDDYQQMTITKNSGQKTIRNKIDERGYGELYTEFKNTYVEEVLNKFKSPYTRVRLVVKDPGSYILPHMDYNTTYSVRYFIPLVTNKWSMTAIERGEEVETRNLSIGKVYFVNVGFKHSAWNFGNTKDIRLIVSVNGQKDLTGVLND